MPDLMETYKKLGVDFDKIYYESDTYKVGKDIVLQCIKRKDSLQE